MRSWVALFYTVEIPQVASLALDSQLNTSPVPLAVPADFFTPPLGLTCRSAAYLSVKDEFVVFVPNVNYNLANMTKKILKMLCSVGPSGLPRAALDKSVGITDCICTLFQ